MRRNGSLDNIGFSDTDWACSVDDRRSATIYCTYVGGNLTTWKSKKQNDIARSSAENQVSRSCELI